MNRDWDTPPDGDFVRYLERLTAPAPGAVARGGAGRPAAPDLARSAAARAPAARGAARPQQPQPQAPRPTPPGPPDLAAVFRMLFGQVADEIRKNARRR